MTPASSSARRPVSRRPARLRSTASADRPGPPAWVASSARTGSVGSRTSRSPPSSRSTSPSPLRTSSARPVPSARGRTGRSPSSGRDTRISGQFLEAAVVAGLASAGRRRAAARRAAHARRRVPDRRRCDADLGVMISASHNPMPDNGIKFLSRGGVKLDDAIEAAIEKRLREPWERPDRRGRRPGVDVRRRRSPTTPQHLVSTARRVRSTASGWSSTARTAPPPWPARSRWPRPAPTWSRSAPTPTA